MLFQFNVNMTDKEYLDYNVFWLTRSPYGKKQMKSGRITIGALYIAFILITLLAGNFSAESFLSTIPLVILLVLFQLLLKRFLAWSLKGQIKTLKKSGKMGYTSNSVVQFNEDDFVDCAPDCKMEHKYSAIERISIVGNKAVYIHVNNVMAYTLPISCFENEKQYDDFLDFMRTKCDNIDVY